MMTRLWGNYLEFVNFLKIIIFFSKILTVHVGVGGNSQTLPHHHHLQRRDSDQSDSPSEPSKPVLRKHGKLITFFRSFILSRPTRGKLKKRGILKERVFSCDLGEYLLNSGQEGWKPTFLLFISHFLMVFIFLFFLFNETIVVIAIYLPFKKGHSRFTTVQRYNGTTVQRYNGTL